MSYAIQCCVMCGELEYGHTGPGDRYMCVECHRNEAAEAAYHRGIEAGTICPGCDCTKSPAEELCSVCRQPFPTE